MSQPSLRWSSLKAGVFIAIALAVLVAAILAVGQKGGVFSDNYRLTARFPQVQGLKPAAPVWLAGVEVGSVSNLRFSTEGEKTLIDVELSIRRKYRDLIREDSVASIESKGLLGDKTILITLGSQSKPTLENGARIASVPPTDWSSLINEATVAVRDFAAVVSNVRSTTQQIQEGKGSFGKFIADRSLYDSLDATAKNLAVLTEKLARGQGSLVKLINDPKLYDEAIAILQDIRQGKGTLAKLINDPNLYDNARTTIERAQATVERVENIVARVEKGEGTAGKVLGDEALHTSLNETVRELRALIEDIKKNPQRYVKISVF